MAQVDTPEATKPGSPEAPEEEKPDLYERLVGPLPLPARCVINFLAVSAFLYLFLLGLDLMGNAFKGMSGKGVGSLLTLVSNPIAGISIGVLATVLLQSSSTTTSIVVTMVGADIIEVVDAIPMIMGANIGTSVTNTIVAHGHILDKNEFMQGFMGATVHDAFNLLSVAIMLPLEIITQAFGAGLLFSLSDVLADAIVGESASTFKSPVKIIVGPVSKSFISIDKNIIKGIAKGCLSCTGPNGETGFCKDDSRKDKAKKIKKCVSRAMWEETYENGRIVKGGFAKGMGDIGGSVVVLVIALVFLCVALYGIVRILHYLILSSGRMQNEDGSETWFIRYTRKVLRISPYLSMFFGMIMTIMVQSSSITTSALTPLVALGIISVEDMLPLTLGANIGTTCTAFLASIVTEKKNAIQIALCHLFFNIFGILIWFPVPHLRRVPLFISSKLGERSMWYKWFGSYYILVSFVIAPLLLFAFSFTIDLGPGGVVLNIVLDALTLAVALLAIYKIDVVATLLKLPGGKDELPSAEKDPSGKVEEPGPAEAPTAAAEPKPEEAPSTAFQTMDL